MTVERDLGIAFGLVVRSMGMVKSVAAGFKALRQGEVTQYTQLLEDSRRHAIDRMIENARLLGANAVVAMRFDSSEMGQAAHRDRRLRERPWSSPRPGRGAARPTGASGATDCPGPRSGGR